MYTKILVPLDGSERAEQILPHVEMLAKAGDAKVMLLQIVDPTIDEIGPSFYMAGTAQDLELHWDLLEKAEDRAKQYIKGKARELREQGIEASFRVLRGNVVEAIIQEAEEQDADLVAMASHGRTGLQRAFYGSVANGVLHKIDRPLLLVRAGS
jgi:nucleotide-binding universal stress UspA family protein